MKNKNDQHSSTEKLKKLLNYPMPRSKNGLINWERFSEMEEEDFKRIERRSARKRTKGRSVPDVVDLMQRAQRFWLGPDQATAMAGGDDV